MRGSLVQYGPMSRAAACHGGMVCYCRYEACAIGTASVAARLMGLEYMRTGEERSSRSASGLAKNARNLLPAPCAPRVARTGTILPLERSSRPRRVQTRRGAPYFMGSQAKIRWGRAIKVVANREGFSMVPTVRRMYFEILSRHRLV